MIYIIETPHQLPPRVWFARDIVHACNKIAIADITGDVTTRWIENFETPLEYNAHDLAWQEVLTEDEAQAIANDENEWRTRHQGIEARHALMEVL